jgi:hypothetical protein
MSSVKADGTHTAVWDSGLRLGAPAEPGLLRRAPRCVAAGIRATLTDTVTAMQVRHICEVCGTEEILTPETAYQAGWDYPPTIGAFGIIGPRTCATCSINQTAWWAITIDGYTTDMLTLYQQATIARILAEPDSVVVR